MPSRQQEPTGSAAPPSAGKARSRAAAAEKSSGVAGPAPELASSPAPAPSPEPAPSPAGFLARAAPGTRVVARYRIVSGFTDALGYLESCDGRSCVIVTRRGPVTVSLAAVVAAKAVPEPPARRSGPAVGPSSG